MTTFLEVVEALIASREHCAGSLGRMQFWVDQFGHLPITEVGEDDVDRALEALLARSKLKPGRNGRPATPTGEPLAGSTVNRFISTLAGIFKYARRVRALPRSHTPPTRGIEKAPEQSIPTSISGPRKSMISCIRLIKRLPLTTPCPES